MIDFFKQITIFFYKIWPRPFGIGYNQYKIRLIKKIIKNKKIILDKYIDERIVEIPWIIRNLTLKKNYKILDAGCTLNFNYLIKKILKNNNKLNFINIFPEKNIYKSDSVKYHTQDISNIEFTSNYFDSVTCLSVIEHIGFDNSIYDQSKDEKIIKINRNLYKKALLELKRVLKPDKWLYLTFPFGKKMIFKNYQQFDYKDLQNILEIFSPKEYLFEFYKYENFKWNKVNDENCKYSEAIYKNDVGISSTSVALVKMKK